MRITNKHLEPRGCDTVGDTIADEKVFFFFYFNILFVLFNKSK
jgi:hypothetical protein